MANWINGSQDALCLRCRSLTQSTQAAVAGHKLARDGARPTTCMHVKVKHACAFGGSTCLAVATWQITVVMVVVGGVFGPASSSCSSA